MCTISFIFIVLLSLSLIMVIDYGKVKTWQMIAWKGLFALSVIILFILPLPVAEFGVWGNRLLSLLMVLVLACIVSEVFCLISWILGLDANRITDLLSGKKN